MRTIFIILIYFIVNISYSQTIEFTYENGNRTAKYLSTDKSSTSEEKSNSLADPAQNTPLLIFPNPTSDLVTIHCKSEEITSITIVSQIGFVVYRIDDIGTHEIKINLESISNGIYILHVRTKTRTHLTKIVKL